MQAWNSHPVAGIFIHDVCFGFYVRATIQHSDGGSPNSKASTRIGVSPLPAGMLPTGEDARLEYTRQGGTLTAFGEFGIDPLKDRPDLISRRNNYVTCSTGSSI